MTMPFLDSVPSPSLAITPSAAIELFWLVLNAKKDKSPLLLTEELSRRIEGFWGDGCGWSAELLVVAEQRNCLRGWDLEPLFDLTRYKIALPPDSSFATEPLEEQHRVRARLERLGRDARLRTRYGHVLRDVWRHAEPVWTSVGCTAVERAKMKMHAALERGRSILDLIPSHHIARQSHFAPFVQAAIQSSTLFVTPSYFAGSGCHIVALSGVLSVGFGVDVPEDAVHKRVEVEQVAKGLKLLGDPTRLLMLLELEREPTTIGELARRVGIAQPTASVHVRLLRDAGLLETYRDEARTMYRVQSDRIQQTLENASSMLLGLVNES
jgi:DNA-binding transcriptional ArsR family regulator